MAEQGRSSPRRFAVEGVDPETGKTCAIIVSSARIRAARRSKGQLLEAARLVPGMLQRPVAVFRGLMRDSDEPHAGFGWYCYCGVPDVAYSQDGTPRPPRPNRVFLVFVNEEKVAYNWYWAKSSPDRPDLPMDYQARFRERLL
jgi:hypothetical protein